MNIQREVQRFKMELFRKMPFYGDIVMHLEIVENNNIQTAATNGKTIWYNSVFLSKLEPGERNFILMHEVFHVLLRHGVRNAGAKRDHEIWNVACDIVVNHMLGNLTRNMNLSGIPFAKPKMGIFSRITEHETAENLYAKIKAENDERNRFSRTIKIKTGYTGIPYWNEREVEVEIPNDIKIFELTPEELKANDQAVRELIRAAGKKNRGTANSYYVPDEIYSLVESRKLDWKQLLKNFMSQEIGDESSYTTPERKYLHMDMILPGYSLTEETVEEVWAFVDSSGSIGKNEMSQFLTQLYRICREFKCVLNLCYWDTSVTDVYKNIRKEKQILECVPHHCGGTNINCVYEWIHKNKVKPDVMLILTDGYFGQVMTDTFSKRLARKTILVLSSEIAIDDQIKKIGKIARL